MALDPSLSLKTNNGGAFDVGQMLSLADMAQQMRQRQTQSRNQNALSGLLANPGSYDPDGTLNQNAQRNVNALSPEFGMKYRQQKIDEHFDLLKSKSLTDDMTMRKLELGGSIADASEKARNDAIKSGQTPQQALEAATKVRNDMMRGSGGIFSTEEIDKTTGQNYDPLIAASLKRFKPGEIQEERLESQDRKQDEQNKLANRRADDAESRNAALFGIEKQNADTNARRAYYESLNIASEIKKRSEPPVGKPPGGFEWDPDQPDTLRAIKGGPKDPDAKKPWQGREKVYTERILGSANQAATAIQNLSDLPVSASTGMLGIGGHAGGSLLSASFDALKNKMSSQAVQDNNVMLAGVKRNLAAIETMGLAPAGALTESMGSLELREGDSNITKLRKFAEMRQIVEKGMDVPLADPAIPPEIKSLATKVVDTVTKAVPYTQADVTKLYRAGQKNPNMTFEELMQKEGLNKSQTSGKSSLNSAMTVPADIQAILDKHGGSSK